MTGRPPLALGAVLTACGLLASMTTATAGAPAAPAAPPPACPAVPAAAAAAATAATSPAAVAQALLRTHFCNGLALDAAAVQAQSAWLTDDLRRRLLDWLARPQNPDEVPDLNGDPWTDSQEYPTRYAVQPALMRGATAEVPVTYTLAPRRWQVTLLMRRDEGGRWRVADLRYRHGETLARLLK